MTFTPTAYSHAITRAELIARFRDRIATGERTKLSKNERFELVTDFIDRLQHCTSEEAVRKLCKTEIQLLEEGYPVPSIANQYMPEYRKAIFLAVEEGRLPKQELPLNEFGKVYPHWALYHFIYPNAVQKAIKEKTTIANNLKQDDLQPIRPDRFLTKVRDLLRGEHPYELAVGILAATGRRFSEIVAKGQFAPTNHPYAIAFRGQLKRGIQSLAEAQTFFIATLVESDKILAAIDKFRAHPRIQELSELSPDEINSRLNTSVRHYIKRDFEDTEILPMLTGEKAVTAHNLRGAYAEIAVRFFCPPNQGTHRFVQQHLGHVIGESELTKRKNAGATEHYFHYRLVGVGEQQLAEKGILLERFGALPAADIDAGTAMQPGLEVAAVEADTEEEEMAIATHQKARGSFEISERKRTSRASVPTELMHELKEVAAQRLNFANGSNVELLEAVIRFLKDETTPAIATSLDAIGEVMKWQIGEIEKLRTQVQAITIERDQARTDRDEASAAGNQLKELEGLRAENAQLKAELAEFYQIKQMLGGGTTSVASTPAMTSATVSPVASSHPPKPGSQGGSATVVEAPQRRIRNEDTALSMIDQAISLIMSWNNDPVRAFREKWFIGVPSLQALLRGNGHSASQGRVQTALANRKQEIERHHAKHGLGQRHNVRHDQPISEDITM